MTNKPSVQAIYDKYRAEERALAQRLKELDAERAELVARADEVRELRIAAEALIDADAGRKGDRRRTGEEEVAAPAPLPDTRRKGRRKASTASAVHNLGIVDAALYLAKEKDIREADAGEVLEWFREVGYKSRSGTPSRNSIYVSLNREFTEGRKRGRKRVTRPGRGSFVFHFDE